jgi:hypothetical protein
MSHHPESIKQMSEKNNFTRDLQYDIQMARKKFEGYEKLYAGLSGDGKKYLQNESKKYKRTVRDIQQLILPSIQRNCPTCINCCKLYTPELSIYIAGSLGCFDFIDYILVRCDTVLPNPNFGNMEDNLCAFWKNGCTLPHDCRSFSCTKYFCDTLKAELDLKVISEKVNIMKSILANFSIKKCLGLENYHKC